LGLTQASDGNLYGITGNGGANGYGTVFKITLGGELTTLYSFSSSGQQYQSALIQSTNGDFYGTTTGGGFDNCYNGEGCGTVFSLSFGLGPFVETLPTSGEAGAAIKILGTDLTGATSVTFNGTAAAFTLVSATEITTAVPAGASTGTVQVLGTASGTLSSNVPFTIP
jgi:uncharacterized repeat protein (TIGR03803 family)